MARSSPAAVLFALLTLTTACQSTITGEPSIYAVDPVTGQLLDRDVAGIGSGVVPHKGEIISIVVGHAFVRYLKDLGDPHVLVYGQVFDDGRDDPRSAYTRVVYDERNQPEGVGLGFADRIVYGPTPYKGHPLRVKLYVVELDKEQKELASKIINAAGAVGSTLAPQYAPAIAAGVQLAQTLNALNEDDFELRFDVTLSPVAAVGTAAVNDAVLDAAPVEPIQRQGRAVSSVVPLQIPSSLVVIKRELEQRLSDDLDDVPAGLGHDWAQEYFVNDWEGGVQSNEVLRLQGGRLQWIVRSVTENGKALDVATVVPRYGLGAGQPYDLTRGIRRQFMDQTYLTLHVVGGLPESMSPEDQRATSERDLATLAERLDQPDFLSQVDKLGEAIKEFAELRRLGQQVSRRVARSPDLRTSTDYPLFWLENVEDGGQSGTVNENAKARNSAILSTLGDLLENLPSLDPASAADMKKLRALTTSDLAGGKRPGTFRLLKSLKTN